MIAITSLCSAAGTLYLSRASERWPTTMLKSASVSPSPACTVFAGRLITLWPSRIEPDRFVAHSDRADTHPTDTDTSNVARRQLNVVLLHAMIDDLP